MRGTQQMTTARCFSVVMTILALCGCAGAAALDPGILLDFTKGATLPADAASFNLHIGMCSGTPNGTTPRGGDGNQILVVKYAEGQHSPGVIQEGDVILGLNGTLFTGNVIDTWRTVIDEASRSDKDGRVSIIRWRTGIVSTVEFFTVMMPDFTKGATRDETHDWTLGPTGARGWMWGRDLETTKARQILVTTVVKASPADGVLQEGDVILGVGGNLFSEDARKAFGRAITEAEKAENKGALNLVRWRKGEQKNVVVNVKAIGTYSPTAPFNCQKTEKIIEGECAYLLKHGFGDEVPGNVNALGALATGRPEFSSMLDAHARKVGPPDLKLNVVSGAMTAWDWGYAAVFLAEYYLATTNAAVLPAIREYAVNIAKGQSGVGSWGHGMAWTGLNGGRLHGSLGGYGALNQAGIICFMALALAKECGVNDPEVDAAIARATKFFGFYINRGAIPYGDHGPYYDHDDNGKCSSGAVVFDLLGNKKAATFFSRMTVASWGVREAGHTGNYFSFLWGALGAARAGHDAVAAFMNELRWFIDMERKWDGGSVYQGGAGRSTGAEHQYGDWDCTGARLLANCLPLRKLRITGKGGGVAERLAGDDLMAVVEADRGLLWSTKDKLYFGRTTADLFTLLGSWSPIVRMRAAKALAAKGDDTTVALVIGLLKGADINARYGACMAIEHMKARATAAVPTLTTMLSDKDLELRIRAVYALASIGAPAKAAVPDLLQLALKSYPDDPREFTQRFLSLALFSRENQGLLATSVDHVDRDLLFRAAEKLLRNDDGHVRSCIASIYQSLTFEELKPLLPAVVRAIAEPAPSGEMFSAGVRNEGLKLLATHHVKEGIPLLVRYARHQQQWGSQERIVDIMKMLESYGTHAKETVPELKKIAAWCRTEEGFPEDCRTKKREAIEAAITRIEASTATPTLVSLLLAAQPTEREDGYYASKCKDHLAAIRDMKGEIDLVFVGDSITDYWQGSPSWNKHCAPRKALNLGISADRTEHVLWRLQHGELEGYKARLFVVMIGTNNGDPEPDVAEGIKAIINTIKTKQPQAKILLLGIFPRGEIATDGGRERTLRINKLIAQFDGGVVQYRDIGANFLQADGTMSKDVMDDFLHPSEKGYEIWANAIDPLVSQLMIDTEKK